MKTVTLLILFFLVLARGIDAQKKIPPIISNYDTLDFGIAPTFFLGSYELYTKNKSAILKCYHETYATKQMKFKNSKEVVYISFLPLNLSRTFIYKMEVRKIQNQIPEKFCLSLNTRNTFITNTFKIKIGDTYNSVITKLSTVNYEVDTSNEKTIIIKKYLKAKNKIFEDDKLQYKAEYIFMKNKLIRYILSINI
ncbi:MAG: hypothetical protein JWN83_236 [Chitinophagaceae bacterium]|nr:hypothetical protein [Chitinophagaceae bacterium]